MVSMLVLFFAVSNAQIEDPVKWNFEVKNIGNKTYELHTTAMVDGNWHLYAQDAGQDLLSMTFDFMANPLVKLYGKVKESGELKKVYNPNLQLTLMFYDKKVDFIQTVKTKSTVSTLVNGSVTYVVCNDQKCLPAKKIPISIKIPGK